MRSVTRWAHMLRQTASFAAPSGVNRNGEQTFGTAVSYRCRLVGKREQMLSADGRQVLSRQRLYLMTDANIDPQSQVTLSTGDVGSTEGWAIHPPIVGVGRYPADDGGFHHTVVFLA